MSCIDSVCLACVLCAGPHKTQCQTPQFSCCINLALGGGCADGSCTHPHMQRWVKSARYLPSSPKGLGCIAPRCPDAQQCACVRCDALACCGGAGRARRSSGSWRRRARSCWRRCALPAWSRTLARTPTWCVSGDFPVGCATVACAWHCRDMLKFYLFKGF